MFNVTVDLERGCVETSMHGFWTLETMAAFEQALQRAIRQVRATGRAPVSLCDYSLATIQSQEVVAAFMQMMANPAVRSRRVAVYTGAVLPKLQVVRANQNHAEFRFFTDRDEARAWLFEPEPAETIVG